ncbi:ECF transporter S component [Xylanibacter muris]|uniref:ECF transporter S component n=1 Tax=Xylanibacter muris TaxID=2736290 RepID=A0ABX2AL06_9BACT|nr:ECF transporter S component [Xylanibacter muris]NPD90850.1 ECF transporter S component [Xylanibacter muris]
MRTKSIKLYSLGFNSAKTYIATVLFVIGNIILPQMFHTIPQGGAIWLPVYFFTLVAAYKYGWRVGLLTAVASPIVNSIFFGMPATSALPAILFKSTVLAVSAGYAARHFKNISIPVLMSIVLFYQTTGTMAEWAMLGNLYDAVQDFRIGIPGMLMQVFGGWLIIKYLIHR